MQPKLAEKIRKSTEKQFPEGIEAYGTDALRFTLTALASTGRDINWDMQRLEGYRNFCNKLWNASRYVLMNAEGQNCGVDTKDISYSLADRWITSRLQHTEQAVAQAVADYRFDLVARAIYEFVWNEYCDWYLELSKPVLWDESADEALKIGTRKTLVGVLETILRLAHPIMPFITEEIWQSVHQLAGKNSGDKAESKTIMLQPYPEFDETKVDLAAEADIKWLQDLILVVRNIRGEMNISPGTALSMLLNKGSETDRARLKNTELLLSKIANLEEVRWLAKDEKPPFSASGLAGEMEVMIPMAGLIDVKAEVERLDKSIEKLVTEASRLSSKLSNQKFVENAPVEVVESERNKLTEYEQNISLLKTRKQEVEAI
jgi:valyl-tRNA synthetase